MNQETIKKAFAQGENIGIDFVEEIKRLLRAGAVDDTTPLNLLFGVALENIADNYVRGDRKTATYRNLKRF